MHQSIRRTLIFFVRNFRKNNDECILILVIYWNKTGLLRTKISNHNLFIIETQKIVITATKIIFTVVFTRCVTNRCTGIYKLGNKYLSLAYKTHFEFRSHLSGKRPMGSKMNILNTKLCYLCSTNCKRLRQKNQ
jgi:hypothetical protein